jgi:hypothetical protein
MTFAPCKVTKCPEECPDDCFYPNASTCCPKSGQAICKNKRHQVFTPPNTTEETTSATKSEDNDMKEATLPDVNEPEKKKNILQTRSYNNNRGNDRQNERVEYYRGRDNNKYYGRRQNYQYRPNNRGYYKERNGWSRDYPIDPLPPILDYNIYGDDYPGKEEKMVNKKKTLVKYVVNGYKGPEAAIDYFPIPGYKPTVPETEKLCKQSRVFFYIYIYMHN